jgi:FkbM family methyltransferase
MPDSPEARLWQGHHCQIVIAIFNLSSQIPPIITELQSLGYSRIQTFLEFHDEFSAELGDRYWLTSRGFYAGIKPTIEAAYALMSDELSRHTFSSILEGRLKHQERLFPKPSSGLQYFSSDLPKWANPVRFVDCGAFDGDTIRQLAATGLPVEAIVTFEPDPVNFGLLACNVRAELKSLGNSLLLYPCGVYSRTEQLRFSAREGAGSHLSTSGTLVVQTVSLDEALIGFRPTLIKMDIEGAEYAALCGARKTIHDHRPGLAICVYHRPEHLWQIALLLDSWDLGYKFYLRAHAFNGFETVLYAYAAG